MGTGKTAFLLGQPHGLEAQAGVAAPPSGQNGGAMCQAREQESINHTDPARAASLPCVCRGLGGKGVRLAP